MKRLFLIVSVALLALTACNDKERPSGDPEGIAMIVKNGDIDYWRQIEASFRSSCQEKGLEAYYYSTSSETAYQEQLAAVKELRKLGRKALKGIILAPSYGINGENAEAEVAALARERGIPVVIIDSPVKANGPLASYPYIGTDNAAAGEAMAKLVSADRVAVFAMINSPGIERATAFKALKPGAEVFRVGDTCIDEVKAVLDKYSDFVFFNGNDLVGALPYLMAAGKNVYTFDVYDQFLDLLISGSPYFKGVMAQNTFTMATKAVETVLSNSKQGVMVPPFFISTSSLTDLEVQPFLHFYNKQIPDLKVAEKIIGKWIQADLNGKPALTDDKKVFTFLSTTKGYMSASLGIDGGQWSNKVETDVAIRGNKVTIIFHPDVNTTVTDEFVITAINDKEFSTSYKVTATKDGSVVYSREATARYLKTAADYTEAILGTWEGRCTSQGSEYDDGQMHRWGYKEDGNFVYYVKNNAGVWVPSENTLNEYFVDGNLLCTRWVDNGEEYREWWEIDIDDDKMNWTALRQNPRSEPSTVTFEMTPVPGIAMIGKAGQFDYWQQIETTFNSVCQEKGVIPYYFSTSADNAYAEQIAALEELGKLKKDALKGIIYTPCYGPNGENAEAEVAALANERGIPVIVFDTYANETGPLASYPFIGTDNTGAAIDLAEEVTAERVAAFAKVNTPGVERGEAFMAMKPQTCLVAVSESAASEVEAVLNDYDDFVFFNGSNLLEVYATLKAAGKNVYTFDVYEEFLDELIAGSTCLKGIMAQNTFLMTRKAVEAALAAAKEGELVPTFYITSDNLLDPNVMPFIEYYKK